MYLLKPFAYFYFRILNRSELGKDYKFYGLPKILKARGSQIMIGNNFENRNLWYSNPIGINHPTIICTWRKGARIVIGDNVGISGGCIVSAREVEVGEGTLIGANTIIIDTDFHPIKSNNRRYDVKDIKSKPIKIGKNVFIGTGCIILKGARIKNNSVISAGSVIR